jgi:hypothetical protein
MELKATMPDITDIELDIYRTGNIGKPSYAHEV